MLLNPCFRKDGNKYLILVSGAVVGEVWKTGCLVSGVVVGKVRKTGRAWSACVKGKFATGYTRKSAAATACNLAKVS